MPRHDDRQQPVPHGPPLIGTTFIRLTRLSTAGSHHRPQHKLVSLSRPSQDPTTIASRCDTASAVHHDPIMTDGDPIKRLRYSPSLRSRIPSRLRPDHDWPTIPSRLTVGGSTLHCLLATRDATTTHGPSTARRHVTIQSRRPRDADDFITIPPWGL
jgi:hypothetical protein